MTDTMTGVFILIGTFLVCEFILSFRRKAFVEGVEKDVKRCQTRLSEISDMLIGVRSKSNEYDDMREAYFNIRDEFAEYKKQRAEALGEMRAVFYERFNQNHKAIGAHTGEIKRLDTASRNILASISGFESKIEKLGDSTRDVVNAEIKEHLTGWAFEGTIPQFLESLQGKINNNEREAGVLQAQIDEFNIDMAKTENKYDKMISDQNGEINKLKIKAGFSARDI